MTLGGYNPGPAGTRHSDGPRQNRGNVRAVGS